MSSRVDEFRARLQSVESAESEADLRVLDETATAIFQEGLASQLFADLFRIFERFPDKDGFGVFWSIVHGLEAVLGYEPSLLESVEDAAKSATPASAIPALKKQVDALAASVTGNGLAPYFPRELRDRDEPERAAGQPVPGLRPDDERPADPAPDPGASEKAQGPHPGPPGQVRPPQGRDRRWSPHLPAPE